MEKSKGRRSMARLPSPSVAISVLALVLAAVGPASAALKGKDKAKVRAIANAEISRLAPGLSVAEASLAEHAGTADTATNATSATNATNATNAQHATSADTATSASGVAPNAIASNQVADHTLVSADWAKFGGATTFTGTSVPAHSCIENAIALAGALNTDVVLVTDRRNVAGPSTDPLVPSGAAAPGTIYVRLCNASTSTVGIASATYNWLVVR